MVRSDVVVSCLDGKVISFLDSHWQALHDYLVTILSRDRGPHVADDDLEIARHGCHSALEVCLLLPLHEAILLKELRLAVHSLLVHGRCSSLIKQDVVLVKEPSQDDLVR